MTRRQIENQINKVFPTISNNKCKIYGWDVYQNHILAVGGSGECDTWHEAADAAIEKALELI